MPDLKIRKIVKTQLLEFASEADIENALLRIKIKRLGANRVLFTEGSIDENNYFVYSGLLKSYLEENEKRIITNFITPGCIISNFPSELSAGQAWQTIETVTNVELLYITKGDLFSLFKTNYNLGHLYLNMITKFRKGQLNRLRHIINKDAGEKISTFLSVYAEYIDQIPQYEIASFLNVRPETVSREKRKIFAQAKK